ncbi:hypothetical protein GCM10025871_25640 [Deinococcus metallilatus]|nr:hypothetical protein GCM10025871_25640 [Deinococcus metallilatus]
MDGAAVPVWETEISLCRREPRFAEVLKTGELPLWERQGMSRLVTPHPPFKEALSGASQRLRTLTTSTWLVWG